MKIMEKKSFKKTLFCFNQLAFSDDKLFCEKTSEEFKIPRLQVSTIPFCLSICLSIYLSISLCIYYGTVIPFKTALNRVIPVFQLLEKESWSFLESFQSQCKHFGKTHMFRKYFDDM